MNNIIKSNVFKTVAAIIGCLILSALILLTLVKVGVFGDKEKHSHYGTIVSGGTISTTVTDGEFSDEGVFSEEMNDMEVAPALPVIDFKSKTVPVGYWEGANEYFSSCNCLYFTNYEDLKDTLYTSEDNIINPPDSTSIICIGESAYQSILETYTEEYFDGTKELALIYVESNNKGTVYTPNMVTVDEPEYNPNVIFDTAPLTMFNVYVDVTPSRTREFEKTAAFICLEFDTETISQYCKYSVPCFVYTLAEVFESVGDSSVDADDDLIVDDVIVDDIIEDEEFIETEVPTTVTSPSYSPSDSVDISGGDVDADLIPSDLPVDDEEITETVTPDLTLVKMDAVFPAGSQEFPTECEVIIKNNSGGVMNYDWYYSIEKFENGEWTIVPLDFAVIDMAGMMPSNEETTMKIKFYPDQYDYQSGLYRVVKKVWVVDIPVTLTAEFNL
ncbi:MAG: hypothetical protein LBM93_12490 [Oscillospiraceae bacterium]|jgi:hypothetical protein|nr:hypothetical protein [Oscillospiraceae bacterium]